MVSVITDRVAGAVAGGRVQRIGYGRIRLIPSSGVDNVVTTGSPTVNEWVQYQEFVMRPLGTNTGAMTIEADEAGSKNLKTPDGSTIAAGMVTAAQDIAFYYDGTNLILMGPF